MEKQKKVLDASVIAKLFTNEQFCEKAIEIVEDYTKGNFEIIVPDLLFIEVTNALRYKNNSQEILKKINKRLWDLEFKVERINETLLEKAIQISLEYNLTIYDAIYVAVAQLNSAQLITADSALFKIPSVISLDKT